MRIYSAYDVPPKKLLICADESRTKQSELRSTDINVIVGQYAKTGMLPQVQVQALYADVSELTDYRDALERVRSADAAFMMLPADVRRRFGNDAAVFLDFVSDDRNEKELQDMGLLPKPVVVPPVVPAVPS